MNPLHLTPVQLDRAAGAVLGSAAGDALGAPYEFRPSVPDDVAIVMKAGGPWQLGEWTDDTSMAIPVLRALARGASLDDEAVQGGIVAEWCDWARTAKDVGIQTRQVLGRATDASAAAARDAARAVHDATGRSAGNGSLMRTGPLALGYLADGREAALAASARSLSGLTHFETDAGDACAIWSLAIRHAIRTGELDLRGPIDVLPAGRRARWHELIDTAERLHPRDIPGSNGWVVAALQAAWAAIVGADTLAGVLERAVRCGNDTDTVAAIAGSLAGARYGASAVPFAWRRHLHGWSGADAAALDADGLVKLAVLAARGGANDRDGWPGGDRFATPRTGTLVRHPHDDGVWLGDLRGLDRLPADVSAVVSLCRVGADQVPQHVGVHHEVWLVDKPGASNNLDLDAVFADTADAIAALRAEGHSVYLHCFEARSRTPSIAAAYSVRHLGVPATRALAEVTAALPHGAPQPWFTEVVERMSVKEQA
ncbi:ADP-ribosylglycohydrolase family protein [Agromyces laixinhei]|uniref:ADP-ribosylglycohydrolase family protein n=1 Tax=Agromyces laixinhei TaxID=2585717 RepID=UPI001115F381|nr:ADP-ribosylglycohydrolase family protein [Agromyces laixinhei]